MVCMLMPFPTFSNPLWWDWRYGSYGWGWNYGWAGIVLTTLGDITRVPGAAGMVATGVASMAAVIGDIITTGVVVLAGAGAVVIETCYTPIVVLLTGVLTVLPMVPDIPLTVISLLVLHQFVHLRIEQLRDV